MEIKIDEAALQESINESATKAMRSALESFPIQQAIGNLISTTVSEGAIGEAIKAAMASIDSKLLVTLIAEELQYATMHAVVAIVEESVTDILAKLRNIGYYSPEDKAARLAILNDLRRARQEAS